MNAFLRFRADRAFHEGMQAYLRGERNHAPARYCEHSGDWMRGWNVAWLAENLARDKLAMARIESTVSVTK